jgi:hypothetical protein
MVKIAQIEPAPVGSAFPHSEPENRVTYLAGTANGKKLFPSVRFLVRSIAGSMTAAVSRMIAKSIVISAGLTPYLARLRQARTAPASVVKKTIMGIGERDTSSPAEQTATMTM